MCYQIKTEGYKVIVFLGDLTLASLSGSKTLQIIIIIIILEMVLSLGGKAKETHGERMPMTEREDRDSHSQNIRKQQRPHTMQ